VQCKLLRNSRNINFNLKLDDRLGPEWAEDICYREPLKEISRLPPCAQAASSAPIALPKKLTSEDHARRDSGLSTGSSEMGAGEESEATTQETDMTGWWQPRVKANLADLLPGELHLNWCHCIYYFYVNRFDFDVIKFSLLFLKLRLKKVSDTSGTLKILSSSPCF